MGYTNTQVVSKQPTPPPLARIMPKHPYARNVPTLNHARIIPTWCGTGLAIAIIIPIYNPNNMAQDLQTQDVCLIVPN